MTPDREQNARSIAVTGMAGRFPGAEDPEAFWRRMLEAAEGKTIPATLIGADLFDAEFFGIDPQAAARLDPRHRILLECGRAALDHAACSPGEIPGPAGVFLALDATAPGTAAAATASHESLLPLLARHLKLSGPGTVVLGNGCASLVALCKAANALLDGECGVALAGGISLGRKPSANDPSPTPADACGVLVLRRLDDALADGDPLLAVIRGWSVQVAETGGDPASTLAITTRKAWDAAGVTAAEISCIETVSSGGKPGDAPAFDGLNAAVGSATGLVGDTGSAAGVVALIKTLLQLRHSEIPTPADPGQVSGHAPWVRGEAPRIGGLAGIDGEGIAAYLVVADPPARSGPESPRSAELLVVSAQSPEALDQVCQRLADHIESHDPPLARSAFTLACHRQTFAHRRWLVAANGATAVARLRSGGGDESTVPAAAAPEVVFLFTGAGFPHREMTRPVYDGIPAFREAIDECAELLRPLIHHDIRATIYPSPHEREMAGRDLHDPGIAQACVFAVEHALAQLLRSLGIRPARVIGCGTGEIAAAIAAGSLKLEYAARIVASRVRLLGELPPGSSLDVARAAEHLNPPPGVDLAAIHTPDQCTVAGSPDAIAAWQTELEAAGIPCQRHATAHATHSAMIDPILGRLIAEAEMIPHAAPEILWISTATGQPVDAETLAGGHYWARQLRRTTRLDQALAALPDGDRIVLLGIGPGRAPGEAAVPNPSAASREWLATLPGGGDDLAGFLAALGRLWQLGANVDWRPMFAAGPRLRVNLPAYPFERRLCRATPAAEPMPAAAPEAAAAAPEAAAAPPSSAQDDEMIARYAHRNARSRDLARLSRRHLADPTAAANLAGWPEPVAWPLHIQRAEGTRIRDLSGRESVDLDLRAGTCFFGHPEAPDSAPDARPPAPGELAREFADLTGMDRVGFHDSAREAMTAAVRLARAATGRRLVASLGSPRHGVFARLHASPATGGAPERDDVLALDPAAPDSMEILGTEAHRLAAIVFSPGPDDPPALDQANLLRELRALATAAEALLILDESLTGFRCDPGGAQAYFGVRADLAVYDAVVAGGLPAGLLAGTRTVMDRLDETTAPFDGGTVPVTGPGSAPHPWVMAQARRFANRLKSDGPAAHIATNERVALLCHTLNHHFARHDLPVRLNPFGPCVAIHPQEGGKSPAREIWHWVFQLRLNGVNPAPTGLLHFSPTHSEDDCERVFHAFLAAAGPAESSAQTALPRVRQLPLTAAQQRILRVARTGDSASCAFNEARVIRLEGKLDDDALVAALNDVIARHPSLRSTFPADSPVREFGPPTTPIEVPVHDFSDLPDGSLAASLPCSLVKRTHVATPFDLAAGPPLRCDLIHLADNRHELVVTVHETACDDASFATFLGELAACYGARRSGRLPRLPAVPLPDDSPDAAGTTGVFEAPVAETPSAAGAGHQGAVGSITIDTRVLRQLKESAPDPRATLLALVATLLHRIDPSASPLLAVPLRFRTAGDTIGHGHDIVPLRLHPTDGRPFREFAAEVGEILRDARPGDTGETGETGEIGHSASMPAVFLPGETHVALPEFDGLRYEVEPLPREFVAFDLAWRFVPAIGGLRLDCEFRLDVHDPATVRSWLAAFARLAESVAADPSRTLDDLDLVGPAGLHQLAGWNETNAAPPPESPVHRLIEQQAERTPEAIALRTPTRAIRYRQLDGHANALALELGGLGIGRGDIAAILHPEAPARIVAQLATLKAGACCLPLDAAITPDDLAATLKSAGAKVLLGGSPALPPDLEIQRISLDSVFQSTADRPLANPHADDPAFVFRGLGSGAGRPAVVIEHRHAAAVLHHALTVHPSEDLAAVRHSAPPCATTSLLEILLPLAGGGAVLCADHGTMADDDPSLAQATLLHATPREIRRLMETDSLPATLRAVVFGGGPLDPALAEAIHAARPAVRLFNRLNLAELGGCATSALHQAGDPVTIGRPIPHNRAFIVDSRDRPVPPLFTGELLVGGATLARGYLDPPELEARRFFTHPDFGRVFRTGERARFLESGEIELAGQTRPDDPSQPSPVAGESG